MPSVSRRLFIQAGAMVTVAGAAAGQSWPALAAPYTNGGTASEQPGARGAIALLPDTQFYSRYGVKSADLFARQYPGLPNPYDCQTKWIVDHTARYNIAMTHHLGDVCDQSGEGHEDQYVVANRAMKILDDAKAPYSVVPGNHDVADGFRFYRKYFPRRRQAQSPSFREMGPSGLSNWHEFTVAGVPMMAVNVPWGSDGDDLDWAESVLNAHKTVPTIITTHQIIDISPTGTALSTQFGQAWTDDTDRELTRPWGHNGCDTRDDALARDLVEAHLKPGSRCVVVSGRLHDPYTGSTLAWRRGRHTSTTVQIDHVVALGNAWVTGAQHLPAPTRRALANDPLNLVAVDGPANEAKRDGDAATWLPPNKAYRCDYVARQIAVKTKYQLWVTPAEKTAMARVLDRCPAQTLPTGAPR